MVRVRGQIDAPLLDVGAVKRITGNARRYYFQVCHDSLNQKAGGDFSIKRKLLR